MKIVGLSGSLRAGSFNTALLSAAADLLPRGSSLKIVSFRDLPMYDADIEDDAPAPVGAFKRTIAGAEAVLIATPEYNYGIPGGLKNALDWGSRPGYKAPFTGKRIGIISASMSAIGGARAQGQLKQVLLGMACPVFAHPEVLVGSAQTKITDGVLTDESTRAYLTKYLAAFAEWAGGSA